MSEATLPAFTAILLAGGHSRRMGQDKAWTPFRGAPLLAHQLATLRQLQPQELFISARPEQNYRAFGCAILEDRADGQGPLGGIESALRCAPTPLVLMLAVDMPKMTAAFLRGLLARCSGETGVVPTAAGRFEPLAAVYPKRAHRLAATLLDHGERTVSRFAERCVTERLVEPHEVPVDERSLFANWNTPADVATA